MKRVIIIAEAGVNHNGDINKAKQLIDVAAEAGADYVKFQTFITELLIEEGTPLAEYQKGKEQIGSSQFEMAKKLELSFSDFVELKKHADSVGIGFLTTVADFISLEWLEELNTDFIKIASGDITNILFLRKAASKKKHMIISTGMANMNEVKKAVNVVIQQGLTKENIYILHCNTEYPTPMEDVNLKAMQTIASELGVKVGYSDHTLGIEIPIAAVAMGAEIIEKHFTLDKTLPGPDHASSLNPDELKEMVLAIRNVEKALSGSGIKEPSKSESKNKVVVRKSIYSSREIMEGEIITDDCLVVKRPGDGIPDSDVDTVIGKSAKHKIHKGKKLNYSDLK